MNNLAGVVRLLKKEQVTRELHGISAALVAFGNAYGKGTGTRKLSASARAIPVSVSVEAYRKSFGEVLVAILTHRNHVFTGQKQNLLRSLEFSQITYIPSVNPNSRSFFNFY